MCPQRKDHVRVQWEGGQLWTRERGLKETRPFILVIYLIFFLVYSCFTMFCYFLQETRPWSKCSILQNCEKATFCCLSHSGSGIFCYPSPRKLIQGLLSSKDTFSNRGFVCSNWAFRRWNKLTLWSFNHLSNLRFVLFCSTISFFGP